ncbi:MAG TPA: hypothetical protein DEQ75_00675 [Alphaproteobacteria bacterium]|nr:hypothetical protein [Alphaproteobacteria bacterium]HCV62273.1 hypothetical protein [Alphaproteobacteria bacterium]
MVKNFRFRMPVAGAVMMLMIGGVANAQTALDLTGNAVSGTTDITGITGTDDTTDTSGTGGITDSQPLDLTILANPEDTEIETTPLDEAIEDEADVPASRIAISTGLTLKKPSSVRLASLGLDRQSVDGLDRLMWASSNATKVSVLYDLLPEKVASPTLSQRLAHVMISRAVPPEGSVDIAETMIEQRLNWLKMNASADDIAAMVRQLPDNQEWVEWKKWLVMHDLINRNDEAACTYANQQSSTTLEPVWHQINAFCQVITGEITKASFGLDILADSGVDDPAYFTLMEKLTNAGNDLTLPEDASIGPLNLVLMDSARVEISSAALQSANEHRASLGGLRYLGDDAQILLGARAFSQHDQSISDIIAGWAILPVAGVSASEALTRLSLGGNADEVDIARFLAWQAIALEDDDSAISDIALKALSNDYAHGGGRSLEIWTPFITGDAAAMLTALLPGQESAGFDEEAMAWAEIITLDEGDISTFSLISAGAVDAIPLLQSLGLTVDPMGWQQQLDEDSRLATAEISLPLGQLMALEESAGAGLPAETLLLAGITLGEAKPWQLGREDAARLVGALHRAGLEDTARSLAREILTGWALERYFATTGAADDSTFSQIQ